MDYKGDNYIILTRSLQGNTMLSAILSTGIRIRHIILLSEFAETVKRRKRLHRIHF